MAIDLERYLEIMRRTGFPVIVAPVAGEPVVLMPLDAYETLVGADPIVSPSVAVVAPMAHIDPPTDLREYDIAEEIAPFVPPIQSAPQAPAPNPAPAQESPKKPQNMRKYAGALQSAEDRFFLEPLE